MKALPSTSLNLKRLVKETSSKEPILIIVSPGSDPSQVSGFVNKEKKAIDLTDLWGNPNELDEIGEG